MKTLHIDCGGEMQGGQWQVVYLVERLEYARLLAPADSPLFAEARKRGIDARPLSDLSESWQWADVVHAHDAHAHSRAARKNLRGLKRPFLVSRRVGFPVRKSFLSRWKYRQASLFLAVSRFVISQLHTAGVGAEKTRLVYDGVPLPGSLSTLQPGRVVALAGKPIEVPGIPIHLTTDLWHDLSNASVFVYRSEMEGLGSAALAAMACGVPLIASNVGGLAEVVEHGRTGLLVTDGDFATPIRRLLDNPGEAAAMGRRSRARVEENFTVDIMVQKTVAAYNEVLGGW